ncbi:uncharacterized protein ASPGLDRAFT_128787 [Aspergillus glaucus CBS 516.65]|uniref:HDA1 complex subunit n=1 Tax=Aspergillus glaucus CBS 516.65 TaxID=1160497 RepID=A0A1L9VH24_ASPGL|nr:hypothetical protein ASPGLDRAFT_128787 [Aspergillus glaucus CBS 516.65]OJJ83165.1 hypothetical protein ASPGLDRAFT_128787 [Aspergillus glaucus CBS 516.65]
MDKYSHIEGATPREKMRNAYAQLHAKSSLFSQNPEPSATPSSAGDIDSSASLPVPETAPLSVRHEKEPAHIAQPNIGPAPATSFEPQTQMDHPTVQTIQPSALTFNLVQDISPGSVHLGPSEFAIPLPMDSRVKDDYERVLADGAQLIREFVRASGPNANVAANERWDLVPRVQGILEKLSNVSIHPDLNIAEHISESESDLQKEAAWAEYSSAKFLFLGYLVQLASDRDLHLVIMVQGGKTLQILERYLLGKGLTYTRPRQEMGTSTNVGVSMMKGSLSFGIQSTQSEGVIEIYKRPSAIISLDRSFNAKSPSVEHMRTTYARDGSLLPVIRLLVSNTSEHIERCFHDVSGLQHLRLVIQYSVRLRDTVGDLQDNALGVSEDAEEVLSCLQSDNFHANWPLPAIEPLQIFSPEELDSAVNRNQSEANTESEPTSSTQKRGYVEDTETPVSKRQRVDPSQDISQLTAESTKFPSQTLGTGLQALESNLVQMKTAHAAELEKLRKTLAETQSRLQEREKAMEALQHRYEFRTRELHKVRQERDRSDQAKTSAEQRSERQKEELTKVKDERTELRHELEKARESLKVGGGSMSELEKAQEEIRRLAKEQAGLERKADYEKNQAEYTREQYQNASKVAAQSGNENRQLRDENEKLKRKVEGDAIRLREINKKNDEFRHLSRVEELETILASREDLLRRKEDELRELRKNRPSTRSTSTPRSPKWAATSRPGSPGINNNTGNGNNGLSYGKGSALRFSSEMSL